MDWYEHELPRRAPAGGIEEFGHVYKGGEFAPFYVPRLVMPQVDEAFYPQLLDFARENQIKVTHETLEPSDIRPHQRVDFDYLHTMDEDTLKKPILSSVEPFVLDGHHRWMIHEVKKQPVNTWRFHLPFREAIAFLFTFPGTYAYGDGHEHQISR